MSTDTSINLRESFRKLFKKSKLRFRQITGTELNNRIELSCKTVGFGGWTISPIGLNRSCTVLSLGVARDIGFDLEIINRFDAELHAFDPTPGCVEWIKTQPLPEKFHFHPIAVGGQDGSMKMYPRMPKKGKKSSTMMTLLDESPGDNTGIDVQVRRIPTIMSELGICNIDILKMDIEGAEYEVIDDLMSSGIRPYQVLVEFHHRFRSVPIEKTKAALRKLHAAGYRLFYISGKYWEFSFIHEETLQERLGFEGNSLF
ncbi:MAG: FkbM family methyltransferase [Chlorobiaceae bacterium]|nr:FkbM family methyltransferase [Chlorobiaceae bacterium]